MVIKLLDYSFLCLTYLHFILCVHLTPFNMISLDTTMWYFKPRSSKSPKSFSCPNLVSHSFQARQCVNSWCKMEWSKLYHISVLSGRIVVPHKMTKLWWRNFVATIFEYQSDLRVYGLYLYFAASFVWYHRPSWS